MEEKRIKFKDYLKQPRKPKHNYIGIQMSIATWVDDELKLNNWTVLDLAIKLNKSEEDVINMLGLFYDFTITEINNLAILFSKDIKIHFRSRQHSKLLKAVTYVKFRRVQS